MTTVDYQPRLSHQPALLARLLGIRELPTLAILLLIIIATTLAQPRFLSPFNIRSILLWIPLLTVIAMGQMMVIITRGIDVSVGSAMGLAAMIVGIGFRQHPGLGLFGGTLVGIGAGLALGAFNGLLVAVLNIPPIVATLGTLGVYRGLTFIISQGHQVNPGDMPRSLIQLSIDGPFGQQTVPWVVIVAIAAAIAAHLFMTYAKTGRAIYAIGGNPPAAALRGIRVTLITFLVYLITGAASGLAGVLYASRFATINPAEAGQGFELIVVAAVVIGGTSIFGGSGSVLGVFLGCLLLGAINVALSVLHIADAWQKTTYGAIILVAVVLDDIVSRRLQRIAGRG